VPTTTKDETGDADTVDATPNNIKTFGDEVREQICPGEPSSKLDGTLFLIVDEVPEAGHRYLDTEG
jgi:hypothetical protein